MKRKEGKSVYVDRYADGTLRITIIDNIDITKEVITDNENIDASNISLNIGTIDSEVSSADDTENEGEKVFLSSVSRTRNTIYDIVHNMYIEWFGTLTISPDFHIDRNDKKALKKYLGEWFNNIKKRYCPNLMYLAIPEPHKKGGFHFHVLLGYTGSLTFNYSGVTQKGRMVYNLKQWVAGFTNFTKVTNVQQCANYVIKYITKDLLESDLDFGKQRYLVSKNIPKKETLEKYFVPLESNYKYNSEDMEFESHKFDINMKRSIDIVKKYGNYDFSFSKNLDLESGDFKFHSTRFFFKLKE